LAILKTEDLTYTYSQGTPFEKTAINKVNLEIEEGELVGVMGHTGSGKSTLIQHFNGLLEPTSGKVYLDGEDTACTSKNRNALNLDGITLGIIFGECKPAA
jgi:energy-coupling factor transport system ATP-binding protein